MAKKIRLKCITGGFKFNDVVKVGKDGIKEDIADKLLEDGLAVEVEDTTVTKKKETDEPKKKEEKSFLDKLKG